MNLDLVLKPEVSISGTARYSSPKRQVDFDLQSGWYHGVLTFVPERRRLFILNTPGISD
jgi:hypothetical protein